MYVNWPAEFLGTVDSRLRDGDGRSWAAECYLPVGGLRLRACSDGVAHRQFALQ